MKKLLVWVVLLGFAFGLSSCKDDDPAPVDPIVGTWALKTYKYTEMPPGFTKYEGFETPYVLGIELGYTLVFNSDGTYSRAYTVDERYQGAQSIYDKGTWTKDGTSVKLTPTSTTDLNLIESYGGTPGTSFSVSGDITQIRMTLATSATVYVLSDDFDTTQDPTTDDFKPVDATILLIFNKL